MTSRVNEDYEVPVPLQKQDTNKKLCFKYNIIIAVTEHQLFSISDGTGTLLITPHLQ